MKKAEFEKLSPELKEKLNEIKFFPEELVEEKLVAQGAKVVKDAIVKITVEEEVNRRVILVKEALKKIEETKKEYESIKPDIKGDYTSDMVKNPDRYSSQLAEKKMKTFELVKSLVDALNKATEENNFSLLDKLSR